MSVLFIVRFLTKAERYGLVNVTCSVLKPSEACRSCSFYSCCCCTVRECSQYIYDVNGITPDPGVLYSWFGCSGAASFRCVRRLNPDFFLGARGSRLYAKQTDKWEVLNTFGKRPGELDADGIVTAWVT